MLLCIHSQLAHLSSRFGDSDRRFVSDRTSYLLTIGKSSLNVRDDCVLDLSKCRCLLVVFGCPVKLELVLFRFGLVSLPIVRRPLSLETSAASASSSSISLTWTATHSWLLALTLPVDALAVVGR